MEEFALSRQGNIQVIRRVHPVIEEAGDQATYRFLEFFAASIRNPGTRTMYLHSVHEFLDWCDTMGFKLQSISSLAVSVYIETLDGYSPSTIMLRLSAIKKLFDYLVTGGILSVNPAAAVKGPKNHVKTGKTPILHAAEVRTLLDSIGEEKLIDLRDKTLISLMVFSFARIGAVLKLKVEDYYIEGKRRWLRLLEKGGRHHEVPVHHKAEEVIDLYLDKAKIRHDLKGYLIRSVTNRRGDQISQYQLDTKNASNIVKKRASQCGFDPRMVRNHTFRASGITAYLEAGGSLEKAAEIAAHASIDTTRLYDRRSRKIAIGEIERIGI